MEATGQLQPLTSVEFDQRELLQIQRNELVLLLQDPYRLNHYADHIVQAQAALLRPVNPELTQALSQTIEQLIQNLSASKKYLKPKRFNMLQRWFGSDIEHVSQQVSFYRRLDQQLQRADDLSEQLQYEIQASQIRMNELSGLRVQMAKYIQAAESFLHEYPKFSQQRPFDHFAERLAKKIESLGTLQASNDIVITQMQLSQQLSFSLLDRFKEAQQILLPAWKYHIDQYVQRDSQQAVEALDASREQLIQNLKRALLRQKN